MTTSNKVIIVEDSYIISLHLKKLLELNGYEVTHQFSKAEDVVDFFLRGEGDKVELLFMDIMLEGQMDGIEASENILKIRKVPIIYLTALTDKTTIDRAKYTMPYGYLIKPFEEHALLTTLEMALFRFNAEKTIKQSQKRFHLTVNSMGDAVVTTDRDLNINFINQAAEEILGVKLEEALSRPVLSVVHFLDSETDTLVSTFLIDHVIRGQAIFPEGLYIEHSTKGKIFIGNKKVLPLEDDEGNILGLVVTFSDITDKKRIEKLEKEKEIGRLSSLIEGQEMERSRISRELHDGIGQMLNAIKYSLASLDLHETKGHHITRLLDETIHETSRISENLLSSKLKNFDLKTCIASLCKSNYLNTKTIINFDSSKDVIEVDPVKKIHIYRIAQEAVNNALKYANSSMISVQLYTIDQDLVLTIEDDGKGFDVNEKINVMTTKCQGIQNMIDRVEIMRGKIDIDSNEKLGTIISIQIPYGNNGQHTHS